MLLSFLRVTKKQQKMMRQLMTLQQPLKQVPLGLSTKGELALYLTSKHQRQERPETPQIKLKYEMDHLQITRPNQ